MKEINIIWESYTLVLTKEVKTTATSQVATPQSSPYLKHAINLGSYLTGAIYGFCVAQQIPLTYNTECALIWTPTVVTALYSSIGPIIAFTKIERDIDSGGSLPKEKSEALETIVTRLSDGAVGAGIRVATGGTRGAINGGARTVGGYCAGYIVGSLLPKL